MAAKLKPTPPPFEARPRTAEPKPRKAASKEVEKERDLSPPPAPKRSRKAAVKPPAPLVRVTAGPFFDQGHPRSYEAWTVITRAGDIVTYHRFRSKEEALGWVGGIK